jgi:hypothetical protein
MVPLLVCTVSLLAYRPDGPNPSNAAPRSEEGLLNTDGFRRAGVCALNLVCIEWMASETRVRGDCQ